MSQAKQRQPNGATNLSQFLLSEARLTRLHRLFKTNFDVTEPSIILEPYLFLGNCISAYDTNRLEKLGIHYILNVAIRDVELCPYYSDDMRIFTIDLRDDDQENILRIFDQAFAFIDEAKRNKSRILVHCSHGQSRSPAIVIAYLMRTYNVSLEQCIVHVVKARPCVLPNDGFLKQLILYDRFLVDRRRQRQAVADKKVVNDMPTTEILIQHNAAVVPQVTTPIILAPPQYPANKTAYGTNMSLVNSSSLGQTSNIQSSTTGDSIHVIPIQVPSKIFRPEKIETILIKKNLVGDVPSAKEKKTKMKQLKENISTTVTALSKKRQSALITSIVKRAPTQTSRSHSAHTDRTQVNHFPPSSSTQQWNVTTYYPANHQLSKKEKPTKYITEIYDKTTNRFIPTTC